MKHLAEVGQVAVPLHRVFAQAQPGVLLVGRSCSPFSAFQRVGVERHEEDESV